MLQLVKIFNHPKLEQKVNSFIENWENNNPEEHLEVFGVSTLDIQKIGGIDTQIWVTFQRKFIE